MPEIGSPAPDFTLQDQHGEPVTLSSFHGKPVVLYFYPKDDTPGCTTQACAFRDARSEYQQAGAVVLGISADDVASHKKFADKHRLDFTLLADPTGAVCTAYGVWKEKSMFGRRFMGIERTTFVIDKVGVIAKIFPKVKVNGHAEAVLATIRAL
jgi:peroxiredoxin Q/BCP